MKWKLKTFLLMLLLSVSFTGYPMNLLNTHLIFGWSAALQNSDVTDGRVLYLISVLVCVFVLLGRRVLVEGLALAALISLSVVFAGGLVSFLKLKTGFHKVSSDEAYYSIHYITLFINILSVVPAAIAVFKSIPFMQFEKAILSSSGGVTLKQKVLLMVVRVVSHVRYDVIPETCLVLMEEKQVRDNTSEVSNYLQEAAQGKSSALSSRAMAGIAWALYISASVIAGAIEYIPFWAVEISRLPRK